MRCPFCSTGGKLLPGFNDLGTLNPQLSKQWHPTKNGKLLPVHFREKSDFEAWWLGECGHEWSAVITGRVNKGYGCPYCVGQKVFPGFNDIATTSPEILKEWDFELNVDITPVEISPGSNKKVWWICKENHSWRSAPSNRLRGRGCPECAATLYSSKTEAEIYDFIVNGLGLLANQNDRAVIRGELDIHIPQKKVAIEFNGLYWHNERAGRDKSYHYDKWLACKEKGIQLIQIWEDDWNRNPDLMKRMLAHKIGISQ